MRCCILRLSVGVLQPLVQVDSWRMPSSWGGGIILSLSAFLAFAWAGCGVQPAATKDIRKAPFTAEAAWSPLCQNWHLRQDWSKTQSVPNPYDSMKSLTIGFMYSVRKAPFKSEHPKTGSQPAPVLASLGGHRPSQRRDTWPGPHASAGCNVLETAWGKPSFCTKLIRDVLGWGSLMIHVIRKDEKFWYHSIVCYYPDILLVGGKAEQIHTTKLSTAPILPWGGR